MVECKCGFVPRLFLDNSGIVDDGFQQILVLTPNSLQVHDVNTKELVERSQFSVQSLMSPTLAQTISGGVAYTDSVLDVAHSIWVYKTKIFTLVRALSVPKFYFS